MESTTIFIGIDISKDYFDAALPSAGGYGTLRLANDGTGFGALAGALPPGSCCVMEATGPYHCALALFLHGHGHGVCVVNPLSVKYFARMRMQRTKTDRADSRLLAEYGRAERPPLWSPPPAHLVGLRQEMAVLEQLRSQRQALCNQRGSLVLVPGHSTRALAVIDAQAAHLEAAIGELEQALEQAMRDHYPRLFDRLRTIPGIGPKTALVLIAATRGFEAFANHRQLVAYAGLAPRTFQSGSSVRGRNAICKMGMNRVRRLLYMCAQSARKHNPACRALFERLRLAAKPLKVALVAVAAKLLKQAFAIAKSGLDFRPDFAVAK